MRDVDFLMRLPAGATGTQMSRHLLEGLLPEDEIRNKGKQTRKEISSAMRGNLGGEQAGISKGHISPMPGNAQDMVKGRTCVSREESSGLDMAMKPTGRANSVGA
jgi:hypothetical protein